MVGADARGEITGKTISKRDSRAWLLFFNNPLLRGLIHSDRPH
jgi:hypothetical protein